MDVHVGVDWGRKELVSIVEIGTVRRKRRLPRNFEAVSELVEFSRGLAGPEGVVRVAIEAGDSSLASVLRELDAVVYQVDGKQARRFAESLSSSGAKDDFRDAETLCKWLQSEAHRGDAASPPTGRAAQLDALLSARRDASDKIVRVINQLRALLMEVFPSLEPHLNFETEWSCRLLAEVPTWVDAQNLTRRRFETLMKRLRVRSSRFDVLWGAMKQRWAPMSPELHRLQAQRLRAMLEELALLRAHRRQVDRDLEQLCERDEQALRLRSMTGAGLVISGTLLQMLDVDQPPKRDDLAVATGCAPVTRQSGRTRGVRMRRAVSTRASNASFWLALQAVRRISWARAMYAHYLARGIASAGALRRIARALLRIISSMLRHGTDYDEQRYIAALKARDVPWAHAL